MIIRKEFNMNIQFFCVYALVISNKTSKCVEIFITKVWETPRLIFSGLATFFTFFFFLHYVSWCVYKYKSKSPKCQKNLPNNWDYWLFAISMFWHSFALLTLCNVVGIISRLFLRSFVLLARWKIPW